MKILYLHQYYLNPKTGSGGTRSYEMAKRFVEAGHEVHIVTSDQAAGTSRFKWRSEVEDGINVHYIGVPYNNKFSFLRRILAFVKFSVFSSIKALRVGGDVVFATSTPLTIILPGLIAKTFLRAPLVFEVRDLWPELPIAIGAIKSKPLIFVARLLEKLAYSSSSHIVVLSPDMQTQLEADGISSDKISCIPNSCDMALFEGLEDSGDSIRRANQWIGGRPLIIYAGTFGAINGVTWLANLAAKLGEQGSDACVVLIGDGFEKDKVISEAKSLGVLDSNFYVLGKVPKNEVVAWYKAADLCCSVFIPLPEMWANSANKFFDALASGTPVLINYQGWQKQVIEGSGCGLVLDPMDFQLAATRVIEFMADETAMKAAGTKAVEVGLQWYSRDKLAAELLEVLVVAEARV